jgi:hypothetical protein
MRYHLFLCQLRNKKLIKNLKSVTTRGRCYDHNFLRFSPIFGEKIGVFLKNQCYDRNLAYFSFVLSQKRQFFRKIFRRKYLKNHNIGPWLCWTPSFLHSDSDMRWVLGTCLACSGFYESVSAAIYDQILIKSKSYEFFIYNCKFQFT